MKALLFLFTICTTLTFGQTPADASIVGEWYSCGGGGQSLPSDLVLSKKSFSEFSSGCAKDLCAYILIRFESTQGEKVAVVSKYKGCKGNVSAEKAETMGWNWSLAEDGKTLFLTSEDKKQYQFAIEKSASGQLTLKRK